MKNAGRRGFETPLRSHVTDGGWGTVGKRLPVPPPPPVLKLLQRISACSGWPIPFLFQTQPSLLPHRQQEFLPGASPASWVQTEVLFY